VVLLLQSGTLVVGSTFREYLTLPKSSNILYEIHPHINIIATYISNEPSSVRIRLQLHSTYIYIHYGLYKPDDKALSK